MKRTLRNDQSGMVAIIITMIMMFVITLIVLGFAENTRRNQRESLDTQLGMQAYYAAETGVNTVTNIINALPPGASAPASSTCGAYNGVPYPRALNADKSVLNTCLMVDPTPATLVVDGISASGESVVWDVNNASGLAFSSLTFSWKPDVGGGNTCSSSSSAFKTYPTTSKWYCGHALLRVDILKADAGTTLAANAAALAANTATLYLQPTNGTQQGITISNFDSSASKVTAYQGACNVGSITNTTCSVTTTLSGTASTSRYYVRLTSLYGDAKDVALAGVDSNGSVRFKDGQVVVDSTGRAQDQLKRIRVRIPLTASGENIPTNAVQSAGSTCKDILVAGTDYGIGSCNSIWPL